MATRRSPIGHSNNELGVTWYKKVPLAPTAKKPAYFANLFNKQMLHIINRTKRTGDIVVATDVAPERLRPHVTEDNVVMESFDNQPSSAYHEQTELTMDTVSATASIAVLIVIETYL